jgi:hypothetical protein
MESVRNPYFTRIFVNLQMDSDGWNIQQEGLLT